MDDKRLARGRRWFEYHCHEGEDSCDAELWHHTHQRVVVLRKLRDGDEVDEIETGKMYRVRFSDGFEYDIFGDELIKSPKDFERPDYKGGITKMDKTEKLTYCRGKGTRGQSCEDDFYNGNNPYGIKECWHLKDAKLVDKGLHFSPNDVKETVCKTLNCFSTKIGR